MKGDRSRVPLDVNVELTDEPMPPAQLKAWAQRYVAAVLKLEGSSTGEVDRDPASDSKVE